MSNELPVASFRSKPADFVVEELPLYAPNGRGEHLYVVFRKTERTTPDAVQAIADALGVESRGAGFAGMKDRRAITTQAATFPFPMARDAEATVAAIAIPGIEILSAVRNETKLKPGHLAGNRFTIALRGLDEASARRIVLGLDEIKAHGIPNEFGPQRFGRDGDNPQRALAWLAGKERGPRDRRTQRFLVSALQSLLFNRVLARREAAGTWNRVLPGDLAKKGDGEMKESGVRHFGGLFLVPLAGPELDETMRRAEAGGVCATGPMFGEKMRWPEGEPAAIERAVLVDALGAEPKFFGRLGDGTRRAFVLPVAELATEPLHEASGDATESPSSRGLSVRFVLPKGGYATTVLGRVCVLKEEHGGAGQAHPDDGESPEAE